MPWQVTLSLTFFLFFLAPFFRKWIDLIVWPKIADRWAGRSRKALEKQIQDLEAYLARPDGPDEVLAWGLGRICLSLSFFIYAHIFELDPLPHHPPRVPGWVHDVMVIVGSWVPVLCCFIAFGIASSTYRQLKRGRFIRPGLEQEEQVKQINERIDHLRQELKKYPLSVS